MFADVHNVDTSGGKSEGAVGIIRRKHSATHGIVDIQLSFCGSRHGDIQARGVAVSGDGGDGMRPLRVATISSDVSLSGVVGPNIKVILQDKKYRQLHIYCLNE